MKFKKKEEKKESHHTIEVNSAAVENINRDGVPHYIDDMKERFYTLEEWRDRKLKELGIC